MEAHQSTDWKIVASEHDARGFVTCTAAGAIVWRGSLAELAAAGMPDFETVYCHDDDVGQIERALPEIALAYAGNGATRCSS